MVCKDTLKIKNLPKELTDSQKEDFARHFGASKVKVITSGIRGKSILYAKFESEELTKNVLFRLHQITVLNCRLSVEYAENDVLQGKPQLRKIEKSDICHKKNFKTFINKLSSFNEFAGFHQPPPSHLKYIYPKPNGATISNIAHALATVPRFYTQVLHLMNKMNLPPPFVVEIPFVRTQHPVIQKSVENILPSELKLIESSSESELDTDEDSLRIQEYTPLKRKTSQKKVKKRPKFVKLPVIQTQTNSSVLKHTENTENVFEKVNVNIHKKIELNVTSHALNPKTDQQEKIGSIEMSLPIVKLDKEVSSVSEVFHEEDKTISAEELAANRISNKDLGILPVFKNYHPGAPTCRLYIKNCAKAVVLKDLEYIFKRYKVTDNEASNQFDIRLMQEGRMKGQAFVTLDTLELAQKALKETNGYILKDKPLVVVFAHSAAQKK